jgi:TldD protein
MISRSLAVKVLNEALATGGDYAEIYLEETDSQSVSLENGKVETAGTRKSFGAGIRILNKLKSVYGYTSDLKGKSLIDLAHSLAASFNGARTITVSKVEKQKVKLLNPIVDHVYDVPVKEKVALLKECATITAGVDPRIVRVQNAFSNYIKHIEIYSAESDVAKQYENTEERSRLVMVAIASENGKIETYFIGPGRYAGWRWFKNVLDYKGLAKECGEKAVMMMNAKECPSGRFPVVITNGWGGVIFHEACGHSLRRPPPLSTFRFSATLSVSKLPHPIVSAFDDGTLPNEWGSNNIDSEGHVTQKNQLIKDGICVGFLVDKFNGRRLKMEANGVSRRQNYRYEPTSRMSNTYIAAGKDKPEDIIKDTKLGIFVTNFGGGSVNPTTGEFNFSASEAYIIRDGKVCEPIRGCTLIGSGKEVLMNIDRVGDDVALGQGMCGSASGSIPVNVGQPTIRIKEITVGGRGGKLE